MCLLQKMSFKKLFFYEKKKRWSDMTLSGDNTTQDLSTTVWCRSVSRKVRLFLVKMPTFDGKQSVASQHDPRYRSPCDDNSSGTSEIVKYIKKWNLSERGFFFWRTSLKKKGVLSKGNKLKESVFKGRVYK